MTTNPPDSSLPASKVNSPINTYTILVAVVAAFGGLLFGFDTGVISGAELYINQTFNLAAFPWVQGMVVASVVAGAMIGAAVGGKLADYYGRRHIVLVTAVIFAVGSIATGLAPTVTLLIIGRVILGIAIGIASCVAPLYISEMAPPQIRGALVSLNQLMITIGIVFSYGVDWGFARLDETGVLTAREAWGGMLAFGALPAVILFVGMWFLPNSPRWLAAIGLRDQAACTLRKLRGVEDVDREMDEIHKSLKSETKQSGNWALLAQPWVRPLLVVGIGLGIFQQVTGINTVIYYAPRIFQMTGLESDSAAILATTGVGVFNVIMTLVAVFLMDRVGRRPLLLIGLAGMAISVSVLGTAFYIHMPNTETGPVPGSILPIVGLTCLLCYVGSFAISLGPIFWLLISEIYPTRVRGMAMGLATMIQWGANLLVTLTFPVLLTVLYPYGTFWLFGALTVFAFIFAWFLMPETKGVTLEEIEEHCRQNKALRQLGKA